MIHIVDDYYVGADEVCYTVYQKKGAIREGKETEVVKPVHYFNSFEKAVMDAVELYRRRKLSGMDSELIEAVKALKTVNNELSHVLQAVTE